MKMNDNSSYSSDEEYSQGNSGFENDLVLAENEVFPKEIYNEANEHLNHLPVSPFLEDSCKSINLEDQNFEWDDFDLPRSGYFLPTCGTLHFQLNDLDAKLDFFEKEIQNLKTSAEPTFDLCWEEIDDLCWGEVECIPQEKCFNNIKILMFSIFIYICFVYNYLILNYKKRIKEKGQEESHGVLREESESYRRHLGQMTNSCPEWLLGSLCLLVALFSGDAAVPLTLYHLAGTHFAELGKMTG
uniref:uncharacterized protein n=1 Tax=Myxine glutinosa TaxID=7769 RepID=UPI00358F7F07